MCTVDDCEGRVKAGGLCQKHYVRFRKYGTTDDPEPKPVAICSVPDCVKPVVAQGICGMHYRRQRIHGDLNATRKPRSTCTVDNCDRPVVGQGLCSPHYNRMRTHGDPLVGGELRKVRPQGSEPPPCAVDDCDTPSVALGMCGKHYQRFTKHGDPHQVFERMSKDGPCLIEDCERPRESKGYCLIHYQRLTNHGHPLGGGTFQGEPLDFLLASLGDETGQCIEWPYARDDDGYGRVHWDGRSWPAHRLVLWLKEGPPADETMHAAHAPGLCHNPSCIQWAHLRWATSAENVADMKIDDTVQHGERNYNAILTAEQATAIRDAKTVDDARCLARQFGVSDALVYAIRVGRAWKHLP
jgi:hypothetical protein